MTVTRAASLGIGSMIGAGIFALLGEIGAIAGGSAWLAFVIAGLVALLNGYSLGRLGATNLVRLVLSGDGTITAEDTAEP